MRKFVIEIADSNVWINGNLHTCGCEMDEDSREDDINKKAILTLANEMDYEPITTIPV